MIAPPAPEVISAYVASAGGVVRAPPPARARGAAAPSLARVPVPGRSQTAPNKGSELGSEKNVKVYM